MAKPVLSEEELGKRWDKCVYDGMVKMSGGFVIGVISSIFLFRKKRWPLILGSGVGLGIAYGQCQQDLNETLTIKTDKKAPNV